jgi:O-antigen/teichoic acid export membrane protein
LRGYFQGWQSMGPTGASQVFEQLVRVLFILITSIILIQMGFSIIVTVSIASLGACFGAIAALFVLFYFWLKRRKAIHDKVLSSPEVHAEPMVTLYSELIRYSIPISFVTLAIPLFQLIDWAFYEPVLYSLGYSTSVVASWFTILTGYAHKLIMIPVSLATAFALSVMPSVTQAFIQKDDKRLQNNITQGISVLLYFLIPASVGLYILAKPLYYTVYGDFHGVTMLLWYSPAAIFMALYTVTAAILQGVHQTRWSVINLIIAIAVKGISTPLLMLHYQENGAVLATTLGFAIGVTGNLLIIWRKAAWDIKGTGRTVLTLIGASLLMGIIVYISQQTWVYLGLNKTYIHFVIQLLTGTTIGLLFYMGLTWKMPIIYSITGRLMKRRKKEKHV